MAPSSSIVTHEVTYESPPFATRALAAIEQLAGYLEGIDAPKGDRPTTGAAPTRGRRVEFPAPRPARRRRNFANQSALSTSPPCCRCWETNTRVPRPPDARAGGGADGPLRRSRRDSVRPPPPPPERPREPGPRHSSRSASGTACAGEFAKALEWHAQAHEARTRLGDAGIAQGLIDQGIVLFAPASCPGPGDHRARSGPRAGGRRQPERRAGAQRPRAGGVGEETTSQRSRIWEESLALRREIGERSAIAASLNNVGNTDLVQDRYAAPASALLEESLDPAGDRRQVGIATSRQQPRGAGDVGGDYRTARRMYQENLAMRR